jgi:hypothetical protein
VEGFLKSALDFMDKRITPPAEAASGEPLFTRLELSGPAYGNEPVTVIAAPPDETDRANVLLYNPYRLASPINAALSLDEGLPILQSTFDLTAVAAAARIAGSDAQKADMLEQFGLAAPYASLSAEGTMGAGLGGFTLRASRPDAAGMAYVFREGAGLVYQVPASALPWMGATFFSLMNKIAVLPYIGDVASVQIRTPEQSVVFNLSGGADNLTVAGSLASGAAPPPETPVSIDPANFRVFYQTLLLAKYDEYYDGPAPSDAEPLLEIVYNYRDDRQSDRVAFYSAGTSRRVFTRVNGNRPFYTYSAYVDKVIADIVLIVRGEKVTAYL